MKVGEGWRAVLLGAALLLPGVAAADNIAGSASQVGAWRVSAYTRGNTATFDHCSLYRVQSDGFGLAVGYTPQGVWTMGAEAPGWGLVANESYTGTAQVGTSTYTFAGRALNARAMTFNVAPEIFGQLKSGLQFVVTVNQKHYAISLDGIEAATQRTRECVRQYADASRAPAQPPTQPSGVSPSTSATSSAAVPSAALVMAIQGLLARLGYDPGPINGEVGLRTNMAIAAFQKSLGERGDGLPSEGVRAKLEKVVTARAAASAPKPKEKALAATGTGFYISPDTIVTNFHVVNGCAELRLHKNGGDLGTALVLATSRADDLAALRTEASAKSFLRLRIGAPIKAAEPVLVFGYPLAEALSSAGNTTVGNVTALAGLGDDSRYIQISAAVQPGNSGGPAIDEAGRLMGVVVAKLNALAIARLTGDIPQNVNFAIKVGTLASFLEAHGLGYTAADVAARELSVTQRAERAEASSIQIACWK
ncbi:MAG: trypsin-like peptidase domain-containing protein [Reyranella sp.]